MAKDGVSGVADGVSAEELLTAIAVILRLSQEGGPFFRNCYPRVVREEGNPAAMALVRGCMEPCPSEWRGLGVIPGSGLRIRESCASFDALRRFGLKPSTGSPATACRCGVLRGRILPCECPLFGKACTPEHSVGACMVSHGGACSAWHLYGMQPPLSGKHFENGPAPAGPSFLPHRRRRSPVSHHRGMQPAAAGARGTRLRRGAGPFRCSRRTARRCSQSARRHATLHSSAQGRRKALRCRARLWRPERPPCPRSRLGQGAP